MKTLIRLYLLIFLPGAIFAATAFAGTPAGRTSKEEEKVSERLVFVTGSLIPQRIQLRRIGTTTYSPVSVIDRREIDQTGRFTTAGALINEPAVNIIGH